MTEWTDEDETLLQELEARKQNYVNERFNKLLAVVSNIYFYDIGASTLCKEMTKVAKELRQALETYDPTCPNYRS